MNLRPLFGNFTDPQYRLSRRAQWDVTWKAHHEYLSTGRLLAMTIAQVAVFITVLALGVPPLQRFVSWAANAIGFTPGRNGSWLAAFAVFLLFVWVVSAWAYRFIYIHPIRRAMRDEGFDLCLHCGYELKGLPEKDGIRRCPECGTTTRPEDG